MKKLITSLLMLALTVSAALAQTTTTTSKISPGLDTANISVIVPALSTVPTASGVAISNPLPIITVQFKQYKPPVAPVVKAPAIGYQAIPVLTVNTAIATVPVNNVGGKIDKFTIDKALPMGMSLDNLGNILGTPQKSQVATTYLITAINSGGSSTTTVSITVKDAVGPIGSTNPGGTIVNTVTIIKNQNGGTITGKSYTATGGDQLQLIGCSNMHITMCTFSGADVWGLVMTNCTNMTVDYNYFEMLTKGVVAANSTGIKVNYNQMLNLHQVKFDGRDEAHFIQFNVVTGAGNEIRNNICENIYGQAVHPHDIINSFHSKGTAASPILIDGNIVRGGQVDGGWPNDNATGAGITLDDGDYQIVSNNKLDAPGCAAVQTNGTHNNVTVTNNIANSQITSKVAADVFVALGSKVNVTYSNNRANWISKHGTTGDKLPGGEVMFWFGSPQGTHTGITLTNNIFDTTVNSANILPKTIITYHL